jgi:carbamoyl-phosphate synthase large subunit
MKNCNVLLTCCGGLISPSQIKSLKGVRERKIRITGVDMDDNAVGRYLCDTFYQVPGGGSPEYIKTLLGIAQKEAIEVILPASHEESLVLAKQRSVFEEKGIKIAVSSYETLSRAYDKGRCYQFLKDKHLPCPEFYVVRKADEFKNYAAKLGFPEQNIVMKPVLSRGGRGAKILTKKGVAHYLLNEKPGSLYADYESTLKTLENLKEDFPEMVLMEYLPGDYYSVDFLAKEGKALIIVPKIRIKGNPSQTLVGRVHRNTEVEELTKNISKAFNFDYNVNIEMKYSKHGQALPYDINPRIAASVAFCTEAGANLIYYAVKLALGEEIPQCPPIKDNLMMIRYLSELYI